jgi:CheY-like chemotaxis protein
MRPTRCGTIVVVEESAAGQELIEQTLREAGHRVLVTNSPLEALELARRVRIDLLVADAAALERKRPGFVGQLRGIQPSLPVLYLAERDRSLADDQPEHAHTLLTPFSLDELQQAVAARIDGGVPPD